MKPDKIITGNKLIILPFKSRYGMTKQVEFDLTEHAGEYLRVWLDEDMTFSTDKHKDHYWQVAELQVPHQRYNSIPTGETDILGMPEFVTEKVPIVLPAPRMFDMEILEEKSWILT